MSSGNDESAQEVMAQAEAEGRGLVDVPDPPPPWLGLAQFHSNETAAMIQKYEHIENLLRLGHHSETEGNFCESLLREFLRATLPNRFAVDTGFIRGNEAYVPLRRTIVEKQHYPAADQIGPPTGSPNYKWRQVFASPQLDVIVHDVANYTPILRSGEFVVVLPDAVRAIIEVKKILRSHNLKDALHTLAETLFLMEQWTGQMSTRFFSAVFAFDAVQDLQPHDGHISATYRSRLDEICGPYRPTLALPNILAVARRVVFGRGDPNDYANPIQMTWLPTEQDGVNICGQLVLFHLMRKLGLPETTARARRFQWPEPHVGGTFLYNNPGAALVPLTLPP